MYEYDYDDYSGQEYGDYEEYRFMTEDEKMGPEWINALEAHQAHQRELAEQAEFEKEVGHRA